jgi:hypothetical protein
MKVGELIQCKVTGKIALLGRSAPDKYGSAWIKIWLPHSGMLSKWKSALKYKSVEK